MLRLLLDHPLWIVLAIVTILVHVGFAVALRRVLGGKGGDDGEPRGPR